MYIKKILLISLTMLILSLLTAVATAAPSRPNLAEAWKIINTKEFVDLTHAFEPGIPHWKGFPDEKVEVLYTHEKHGFTAHIYTHVGQWGTHIDPPVHFAKGKRTLDQIDVKEMIMPLVVIDIHKKVAKNPDYTVTMDDVKAWEAKYGKIPMGSFVALRTDWSKRWPDMAAMANKDNKGIDHYPGWSMEVLKYLYEERKITASGHETTDTDPGLSTSQDQYPLENYILTKDHYQIELLANLDKVSENGALVIVSFPKVKDGSGFPARVFAILP